MKVSCKAFLKKSRILTFLSVRTQFGEPFSRWMSIYSFKPRPLCRAKHELPKKYMILWDIEELLKKNVEFLLAFYTAIVIHLDAKTLDSL